MGQLLDIAMSEAEEDTTSTSGAIPRTQQAAAWFAALLIFVILPLWGKMLLEVGCCHADPHPGNFKVDGIPDLQAVPESTPAPKRSLSTAVAGLVRRKTNDVN